MALGGGREERAGQAQRRAHHACSVYDGSRVQNRAGSSGTESYDNSLMRLHPRDAVRFSRQRSSASPPPGSRLPQAQLSRNSNQIARGRIRRFESCMPRPAVRSLGASSGLQKYGYVRSAKVSAKPVTERPCRAESYNSRSHCAWRGQSRFQSPVAGIS
jgi:hypothetical protein